MLACLAPEVFAEWAEVLAEGYVVASGAVSVADLEEGTVMAVKELSTRIYMLIILALSKLKPLDLEAAMLDRIRSTISISLLINRLWSEMLSPISRG